MSRTSHLATSLEAATGEVLPGAEVHPPPRVVVPGREESRWERSVHALAQWLANRVVRKPRGETLRFGLVKTPEELAQVGQMRLRVYQSKLPYLLQELSADGTDAYDAHSFVFAVWRGEQVVATLRATRYPFETLRYVPEPELGRWLGGDWKNETLEFGRLLADAGPGFGRLTAAMLSYAGVYVNGLTTYRKCFGYSRPHVHQSFNRFRRDTNPLSFQIPHRGTHAYVLVKTEFLKGLLHAIPGWLAAVAKSLLP